MLLHAQIFYKVRQVFKVILKSFFFSHKKNADCEKQAIHHGWIVWILHPQNAYPIFK